MTTKKTNEQETFEKALARLEIIVEEMEEGSLNLDKMMKSFEEGMSLVKFCTEKLNEVEKKIEILLKKGEEIISTPFNPSAEDENMKEVNDDA